IRERPGEIAEAYARFGATREDPFAWALDAEVRGEILFGADVIAHRQVAEAAVHEDRVICRGALDDAVEVFDRAAVILELLVGQGAVAKCLEVTRIDLEGPVEEGDRALVLVLPAAEGEPELVVDVA